jgi:large exoprotein involved in heme utilization and adhesion
VANGALGDAGKIEITTGNLSLDRSSIIANTSGFGNAGDIFIQARNNILLDRNSLILATVEPGGRGDAGDVNIF